MKSRLSAAFVVLALLTALSMGRWTPVAADGLALKSQTATNQFPNGVQFSASFTGNADITSVRFHYRVGPEGPSTTAKADCGTGKAVDCNSSVGQAGGSYVVPRTDIRYYWEATDSAGQTIMTDEATYTYQDTRFNWQSMSDGNLTVYYYAGDTQTIQTILSTAHQTIDKMSALEGTSLTFPVKILLYQSAKDAQPAFQSSRDPGRGITLGEVASSDTAIVSREGFALDTVRHEITHVVTDHAVVSNPGFSIWINEGLSMYAQNDLEQDEKDSFDFAIRTNRVYQISSLESVAVRSNDPGVFYPEARSLITYLINTQGADKLPAFLAALNKDTTDGALKTTYGFGLPDLENMWRASLNLPPIAAGATSNNSRPLPTIEPFGSQGSSSSAANPTPSTSQPSTSQPASTSKKGGSSLMLPLIMGAVVAGAAVFAAAFARRRKQKTDKPE